MEMESSKIDFKYLYKITRIELNVIEFKKYDINRTHSIVDSNKENINLGTEMGTEKYTVLPEVNEVLTGKVGELIKGFKGKVYGKKSKKYMINEIIMLE